jgi:hypothetical protein
VAIVVYCSGSIKKGPNDNEGPLWGGMERDAVCDGAATEVLFLNPDDPIVDPGNTLAQFGRDMYQVWMATAVIVDARVRRGLGVGVEMAVARMLGTPVIVVAPQNSKYRMDSLAYRGVTVENYVHPHVAAIAEAVVDTFHEAGRHLAKIAKSKNSAHAISPWLQAAMDEYATHVLPKDPPMLAAVRALGYGPSSWGRHR